jgi:hypothetical protein
MSTQQATRRSPARSGLTALNSVQLRRLLDFSARHPSMRDLHDVALTVVKTGIEPGELTHVRWAHVDPRARTIFMVGEEPAKRWCWSGSKMTSVLTERQQREPDAEFVLGKAPEEVLRRTMRQFRKVCLLFGWGNVRFDVLRAHLGNPLAQCRLLYAFSAGLSGSPEPPDDTEIPSALPSRAGWGWFHCRCVAVSRRPQDSEGTSCGERPLRLFFGG